MSEFEDRIMAEGKDGEKYYLPKQVLTVDKKDWKARALAAGGLLVGAAGLVYQFAKDPSKPEVPNRALVATVEAMQTTEYQDALMDCMNENVLKDALGFEMGSMEDCQNEREYAATRAADRPNRMYPDVTQVPGEGS